MSWELSQLLRPSFHRCWQASSSRPILFIENYRACECTVYDDDNICVCAYVYRSLSVCAWYIFHICEYTHNCERLLFISTPFASKTVYSLSNRIIISISIFNMYSVITIRVFSFSIFLNESDSNDMICKRKIRNPQTNGDMRHRTNHRKKCWFSPIRFVLLSNPSFKMYYFSTISTLFATRVTELVIWMKLLLSMKIQRENYDTAIANPRLHILCASTTKATT